MIEELLPYYEKQLQEFALQSRVFAKKYPKIAQRLSLNQEQIDDPHIERLIQAFSLIAARIDKKLEDSYDVFTRSLFEVMFPQYLRHFPACTVVSFEDIEKQKKLTEGTIVPENTTLKSRSVKGVQCEFKTSMAVQLLPLQLKFLEFQTNQSSHLHLNQNATLVFSFEAFNGAEAWLDNEVLPIYLDAISNFPLQFLDAVFKSETSFSLKSGQHTLAIENPFEVMGFAENESLLPLDQHTHHAYRLLMEYFCFSEKFNYLKLNLKGLKKLTQRNSQFELHVHLKLNLTDPAIVHNYSALNIANFKLFSSPAVNLFEKKAEPQKIDHKKLEYPILTDAHHPEFYRVYSILNMQMMREKHEQDAVTYPITPFFAMSHAHKENVRYFYALNQKQYQHKNIELGYSIISRHLNPHEIKSDFISTNLLCSNGNLPYESMSLSQHTLNMNGTGLVRRAQVLKRPTPCYVFNGNKEEQWRLISHLSLNLMTLMQENAVPHIQELLALYNLSNAKENHLLIDAIQGIEFESTHKMMNIKPFPAFVRGIKVKVSIKAEVFRGHSLYIFSQLLSYVFNLKVQMNSFVDLIIFDDQSRQELYQCVQNVGGKKLL